MKWVAIALTATLGILWLLINYIDKDVRTASALLRSESIAQLLTNRVVTQVFVERDFSDPLWGTDLVRAVGTVSLLVGVDLDKLQVTETTGPQGRTVVYLPKPEVFEAVLDEDSFWYMRTASGFQRFRDIDGKLQHSGIRKDLIEEAKKFAVKNGLLPTQEDVGKRIQTILTTAGFDTEKLEINPLTQ